MARCGCSSGTCSCSIVAGEGIVVSGAGSAANPYEISIGDVDLGGAFQVIDSDTLNLTLTGEGNQANPFVLSGEVVLAVGELSDVDLSNATPGNVLALQGDLTYDLVPPTTAPVGAITTDASLEGDGSGGDPLLVHDYANLARLAGSDATPNMQSIDFGDPANAALVDIGIARQVADGSVQGNSAIYLVNGSGSAQSLRFDYIRDGNVINSFTMSQTGAMLHSFDGANYHPIPVRVYNAIVSVGGGSGMQHASVVFPAGRFSAAPIVQVTPQFSFPSTVPYCAAVSQVTAAGCTVSVGRADGGLFVGAVNVHMDAQQL